MSTYLSVAIHPEASEIRVQVVSKNLVAIRLGDNAHLAFIKDGLAGDWLTALDALARAVETARAALAGSEVAA